MIAPATFSRRAVHGAASAPLHKHMDGRALGEGHALAFTGAAGQRRMAGTLLKCWGWMLLCAGLVGAASPALVLAAPQAVTVPSLDAPLGGAAVALPATWFSASTTGRAPALVLLHGCGGLGDSRDGGAVRLAARYTELAAFLNGLGIHVLVTDSLTPRGERELCTQRTGERRVTQLQRRRDALGALRWLAAQPGVDTARLGVLGWSNGGSTVLAATNLQHPEVARAAAAGTRASLAVALYPGCEAELKRGYRPAAPLMMLLGEADDWTPAAPCKQLAAQALPEGGVAAPQFEAYEGAHHGFDGTVPVRLRRDVPNGVSPGQGVHAGAHPEARAAARQRLERFLREIWSLVP
ncbi:MAG: prolyl oligopeptidase family serine peptidase [Rubrivivax sp.]|nr:prolyl oligopeptidase family serine peptidase [Rubrivivax sp.]